jgi:hypothetical protein
MLTRKPARRRSLLNPEPTILYPDGMRPVRAPFIIGAEYSFDNFVDGVFVLRLGYRGAAFVLDRAGATPQTGAGPVGIHDEAEFFAMKPRLVRVDRQRIAYDVQSVYTPLLDPDDDPREAVSRSAEMFAHITGTKKVSLGRTKASVEAARKQLRRDVRAFAEANRIDPYEGRAL